MRGPVRTPPCGPDRAAWGLDEPLVLVRGRAQRCARALRRTGRAAVYPRGPAGNAKFPGSVVTASGPPAERPSASAICCTATPTRHPRRLITLSPPRPVAPALRQHSALPCRYGRATCRTRRPQTGGKKLQLLEHNKLCMVMVSNKA